MTQLAGVDASFLYFETPETPMHVAGFTLFELPDGYQGSFYEDYRAFFESRLHLIPIFGKKLAPALLNLDHPIWVDDDDMDLDYHLRHTTLPKPGTFEQMEEVIARLHANHLDRSRPLWQFYIIDGLNDGRVALYSKVHHAAVDGGSGMVITKAMYDLTAEPRKIEPPPPKPATSKKHDPMAGAGDLVSNFMRQQYNLWRSVPDFWGAVANTVVPKIGKDAKLSDLLPKSQLPNLTAPKTPFNVAITNQRSYAARSLSLGDAKAVGKATGAKLNDVVMAISSGALRRYLQDKKALPKEPLIAFVPVSLREPGNTEIRNQVFVMSSALATDVADPLERLQAIQRASGEAKQQVAHIKDVVPQDYSVLGAPLLLRGLMDLYGRTGLADWLHAPVNVVISNTQGPPVPLYGAGAKVSALYPVSIPTHGLALNITVQSYMGHLDFGLTGDRRAVPDIAIMADYLADALDELKAAVLPPTQAALAQESAGPDTKSVPKKRRKAAS